MIVCSCNLIQKQEVEAVVNDLLTRDPWQFIPPETIYFALNKRGKCFGCLPNLAQLILTTTLNFHKAIHTPDKEIHALMQSLQVEYNCYEMAKTKKALEPAHAF